MQGPGGADEGRFARGLLLLTAAGLLLRLAAGAHFVVIERDAAVYLDSARTLLAGDWLGAARGHFPPGFPAALAAAGWFAGGVSEGLGQACSAALGALVVAPLGLVARRAFGARAGLWAALLAASSPMLVELGGTILADGLYCALMAWALVFAQRAGAEPRAALGLSLCGGLAYLTRPEGAVVLVALAAAALASAPASAQGRLRLTAWLLAPAALLAIPFVLAIRDTTVLEGGGVGELKLTRKRDLALYLRAATLGGVLDNGLEQLRYAAKALLPALPLAAALALPGARRLGPGGRRLLVLVAPAGLGLWLAMALVRTDRRWGAQLAVLALPFVAHGARLAADRARRAVRSPRARRVVAPAIALAVVALGLPWTLRDHHAKKATYRDVGAALAAAGVRTVLARDSRAGYYGGAETLPMIQFFPTLRRPPSVEALRRVVEERRPDAVVLVVDDEVGRRLSRDYARVSGVAARALRRPGAVALDLFVLTAPRAASGSRPRRTHTPPPPGR